MSRSRKKHNIIKISGYLKQSYWKIIRRKWKQEIKQNKEPTDKRLIVNDYDYTDWKTFIKKQKYIRK